MGVLSEFVKKQAEYLRSQSARREEALQDWLKAIQSLNEQIAVWVKTADSGSGLLESRSVELHRQEATLGAYSVPGLLITLGGRHSGRSAEIVPRARFVAARIKPSGESERRADGMVELKNGSTAEFYLFRLAGGHPGADRWFIRSVDEWNSDPDYGKVHPLDQERFEAALLQVLQ